MKSSTKNLKSALTQKQPKDARAEFLSTGCTLLNLACSDRATGGLPMGCFVLDVGDSSSGKTVRAGTYFAEAAINRRFDNYSLVFDNVENGALMFEKFFGKDIADRIQPPCLDDGGNPSYSRTVEEFYHNLYTNLRKGPCIYVLDSENALSSEAEIKKQKQKHDALDEGTEVAGTMTDAKAKVHSQNLRGAVALLRDTGSLLVMISQTRDNMGMGAQYQPKTRSGGRALKFYAMMELWSSVRGRLYKTVRGKQRQIGIICEIQVKKNRLTGKERTAIMPLYHSFGFDDVGACIDYLCDEKHWPKKDGVIKAADFEFEGKRDDLVAHIESNNFEKDLRGIAEEVWQSVEEACVVHRKSRYTT